MSPLTVSRGLGAAFGSPRISINTSRAEQIPGWMSETELRWLASQATRHDVIVELGSYLGRSTRALGDHARGVVFAMDDWKGLRNADETPEPDPASLYDRFSGYLKDLIKANKVIPVRVDHAKPYFPDEQPDMVFIDGDHTFEGVRRDILNWLPRMATGGMLCGHDWQSNDVQKAVKEILHGTLNPVRTNIWSYTKT